MSIEIIEANFHNPDHASAITTLTDAYASDPMGMSEHLSAKVKQTLIDELKNMPTALVFLVFSEDEPVGIANCFLGFSTFQAKKLINIHDLAVLPAYRGQGIGDKLLAAVQKKAKELKCCKLTLEVRDDNPARRLYERFGFEEDDPSMWFLTKEFY